MLGCMEECLTFNFISKNPTYSIQDIVSVLSQCMCYSCNAPRIIGNFSEAQRDSVGTSDKPVVDAVDNPKVDAVDSPKAVEAEQHDESYTLSTSTEYVPNDIDAGQGKVVVWTTPRGKILQHPSYNSYHAWSCRCVDCCIFRMNRGVFAGKDIGESYENFVLWRKKLLVEYSLLSLQREWLLSTGNKFVLCTKTGKLVKHGTSAAVKYGCFCVTCSEYREMRKTPRTEQQRERDRAYREKNRERINERKRVRQLTEREKETKRRYRQENSSAVKIRQKKKTKVQKERNDFSLLSATRDGVPFTPEEDAILLSNACNLALALSMGRGLFSIRNRKVRLWRNLREQGIDPDTMQPLDNQD